MSYLNAYGKKEDFKKVVWSGCGSSSSRSRTRRRWTRGRNLLAQATVGGDQAAAQLGAMLVPMILQEVQAGGGGVRKKLKKHNQYLEKWKICRDNSQAISHIP
jgi:hypothetical protein